MTGASSGIGAATAIALAELGAAVAIGCYQNAGGAERTRDQIVGAGGRAIVVSADVRRADDVRTLVERVVSELGPIDILVNNAGSLLGRLPLADMTDAHLDDVFALNLKSAVFATQAVAPSMIERRRGAIVNLVSIAGHNGGGPGAGAYASAKAALTSYTKSMAKELAPHGVRVNAVSPGVIDTPFHEKYLDARDDSAVREDHPARPGRHARRVRQRHRVSRLRRRQLHRRRDDRGQRGTVDELRPPVLRHEGREANEAHEEKINLAFFMTFSPFTPFMSLRSTLSGAGTPAP